MEELTFERANFELEGIVAKLESGTLSMEEALKAFERGQELIKFCFSSLDKAKGKLTEIKESLGKLTEE